MSHSPEHYDGPRPMVGIFPNANQQLAYPGTPLAINYELLVGTLTDCFGMSDTDINDLAIVFKPKPECLVREAEYEGFYIPDHRLIVGYVGSSLSRVNIITWHELYHFTRYTNGYWDTESQRLTALNTAYNWWIDKSTEKKLALWNDPLARRQLTEEMSTYQYAHDHEERKARKYQRRQARYGRKNFIIDYETYMKNPGRPENLEKVLRTIQARNGCLEKILPKIGEAEREVEVLTA